MLRDREYSPDDLVSVSIAARMLGVSVQTMRKYADDGVVPVQRTPTGHRRFRVADVAQPEAVREGDADDPRSAPPATAERGAA